MTKLYIAMQNVLLVAEDHDGTWQVEEHLQGQQPQCLAVDPLRPEHVYCGTFGQGVWHSLDGGASWQPAGTGIDHPEIMAVAVSAVDRVGANGVAWAGTEPSAIYRSDDGGITWLERPGLTDLPSAPEWSYPPRPWTHHVRAIGLDPHDAQRVYLCIENGALVRSFDGGNTWQDRTLDGPHDTHTLALHPAAPGRLYSAAGDGFVRAGRGYSESDDGGDTWQRPDDGLQRQYGWGVAVDPHDPNTILVSMAYSPNQAHNPTQAESSIYRKTAGSTWQEVTTGLPPQQGRLASVLATNEHEPGVFYAVSNLGVYRSADAGVTWEQIPITWPQHYRMQHVQALVVTPD